MDTFTSRNMSWTLGIIFKCSFNDHDHITVLGMFASQHLRWERLDVAPFDWPAESNWWCGDHPMRWLQSNVCAPLRDFAPACADFSPRSWHSNIWWHFPPTTWPILCYDASSICPAPVEHYMIFTEGQWESATFVLDTNVMQQHLTFVDNLSKMKLCETSD